MDIIRLICGYKTELIGIFKAKNHRLFATQLTSNFKLPLRLIKARALYRLCSSNFSRQTKFAWLFVAWGKFTCTVFCICIFYRFADKTDAIVRHLDNIHF